MNNNPEESSRKLQAVLKIAVFIAALLPFAWFLWQFLSGQLANPVEYVTRGTGDWALRFLLITLCMTPLRQLTGWRFWFSIRRMMGLFAFFYVCVHFMIYAFLDVALNADADAKEVWQYIYDDIIKRPYITIGFTALLLLIPMAITSTKKMIRRLGKNWKRIHRMIYVVAVLGVVHYFWLVKKDLREPLIYAVLLAVLLGYRVVAYTLKNYRATAMSKQKVSQQ